MQTIQIFCKKNLQNMLTTLSLHSQPAHNNNIQLAMLRPNNQTIHLSLILIVMICLLLIKVQGQLPNAFTIVRNLQTWLSYDDFLNSISKPSFDSQLRIQSGYNMVSLAGFTEGSTYSGLDSELSPLLLWKKVYQIIMGNRPNIIGASSNKIQKFILQNVFHANGSRLLMHVDLQKFPVSGIPPVNATMLAQELVVTVTQLQLDGISILFTDHNAVRDNTASDWLESLLRYIKTNTQNTNIITVLIIPPTFVNKMRIFKSTDINYLVDYFVLKYFGTTQADYLNYQSTFEAATYYAGTSMFELLTKSDIYIDICRTMVAKPADQQGTWIYMQYMSSTDLNTSFVQAYNRLGWFGGFANLNYEADKGASFANAALAGLRDKCARYQNCLC